MLKKICIIASIVFISFFIGLFVGRGTNSNIEKRIAELAGITKEIGDNQRNIEVGVESVKNSINGIRESTIELSGRIEKSEKGFDRLEKINRDNAETIGKLITGNTNAGGASTEIESINTEFGSVLDGIESRNKPVVN